MKIIKVLFVTTILLVSMTTTSLAMVEENGELTGYELKYTNTERVTAGDRSECLKPWELPTNVFIPASEKPCSHSQKERESLAKLNNEKIVEMLDDSGSIEENGLHADKLDLKEKRRLIEGTENIDIANSDVYVIDREIDNNVSEKTVVVKAANKGNGYISHTKEGRVTITCVLGYEKRTIANVPTTRGTYFGGKVNSVQSMVQVTGLTGVYHDAGAYFLANGSSGFSPDYRKTKSFDVAKMKTLQKQTVNRSYYFTTNYGGFVDAKYTAKYKTGGNSYSISVTINA